MSLQTIGFVLLPARFDASRVAAMCEAVEALDSAPEALRARGAMFAIRNLERHLPAVVDWAAPLEAHVRQVIDGPPLLVRAILFDKPPQRGWWLPWHRDTAIPAAGDHPDFRHPTIKAGVPHLEAPRLVLSRMVTARIHLDRATAANGALEVVPGSHLHDDDAVIDPRTIECEAGDVLLMRPRLLHRSSRSTVDARRRVIHLEFAPADLLPPGLRWQQSERT